MKILLGPGLNDPKGNEAFLVAALKKKADVRTFDAQGVVENADNWAPDVVVIRDAEYYPIQPGIEDLDVPIIGLVGDYNLTLPRMLPVMGVFDHILCDLRGVELFERLGHKNVDYFCLYGYEPSLHRDYGLKKQIDVAFVGNLNFSVQQDRARYLHELLQLRDKFKIVLASNVYGEDYARLLNSARVVANFPIRGELNMRFFEAYGCGAVCMQPYSREAKESGFLYGEDYAAWINDAYIEASLRSVRKALDLYSVRLGRGDMETLRGDEAFRLVSRFSEYTYDRRAELLIEKITELLPTLDPYTRSFRMLTPQERKKRWTQYQATAHKAPPWDEPVPLFDQRMVAYQKALVDNVLDLPNFDFDHWAWWVDLLAVSGYSAAACEFLAEKEDVLRCFRGYDKIQERLRRRLNLEVYGFSV